QASLRYFLCDGAGAMVLTAEAGTPPGLYVEDCWLESAGTGLAPHMFTRVRGHAPDPIPAWERGDHHLNQDFRQGTQLAPDIFRPGVERMMASFGIELSSVRFFLANIPNRRFLERCIEEGERRYGLPAERHFSTLARRGYSGPPAILISLDDLLGAVELNPG